MNEQTIFDIMRLAALCARLQVSKATVYSWLNPRSKQYNPDFPRPLRLGASSVGWLESEVNEFVRKRAAERDQRLGL